MSKRIKAVKAYRPYRADVCDSGGGTHRAHDQLAQTADATLTGKVAPNRSNRRNMHRRDPPHKRRGGQLYAGGLARGHVCVDAGPHRDRGHADVASTATSLVAGEPRS